MKGASIPSYFISAKADLSPLGVYDVAIRKTARRFCGREGNAGFLLCYKLSCFQMF